LPNTVKAVLAVELPPLVPEERACPCEL
jgi:hypothetical protein